MKNSIKIFLMAALTTLGLSCGDDFLNKTPVGGLNQATLANPQGVEATLIGAYSLPVSYTHLDVYKRQTQKRGLSECNQSQ